MMRIPTRKTGESMFWRINSILKSYLCVQSSLPTIETDAPMFNANAVWKLQSEINKLDTRMPGDPRLMAFTDLSSARHQEAIHNVQHGVMSPSQAARTMVNVMTHTYVREAQRIRPFSKSVS